MLALACAGAGQLTTTQGTKKILPVKYGVSLPVTKKVDGRHQNADNRLNTIREKVPENDKHAFIRNKGFVKKNTIQFPDLNTPLRIDVDFEKN